MANEIAISYFNEPVDADALGIPEYKDVIKVITIDLHMMKLSLHSPTSVFLHCNLMSGGRSRCITAAFLGCESEMVTCFERTCLAMQGTWQELLIFKAIPFVHGDRLAAFASHNHPVLDGMNAARVSNL